MPVWGIWLEKAFYSASAGLAGVSARYERGKQASKLGDLVQILRMALHGQLIY